MSSMQGSGSTESQQRQLGSSDGPLPEGVVSEGSQGKGEGQYKGDAAGIQRGDGAGCEVLCAVASMLDKWQFIGTMYICCTRETSIVDLPVRHSEYQARPDQAIGLGVIFCFDETTLAQHPLSPTSIRQMTP